MYSDDGDYTKQNCPCTHYHGYDPPSFVGNRYYCESGNTRGARSSSIYSNDVLWDGHQCHGAKGLILIYLGFTDSYLDL